jgi:hypothetical protein
VEASETPELTEEEMTRIADLYESNFGLAAAETVQT